VDSRSTRSTFVVDDSTNSTSQTIIRPEYDRVSAEQDAYIAGNDTVVVHGYIGSDPAFRTRARLVMEAANANVAGMQQQLYYPVDEGYDPATGAARGGAAGAVRGGDRRRPGVLSRRGGCHFL
jgi:phosphoenolpyruvate carboxykinase (ATP)